MIGHDCTPGGAALACRGRFPGAFPSASPGSPVLMSGDGRDDGSSRIVPAGWPAASAVRSRVAAWRGRRADPREAPAGARHQTCRQATGGPLRIARSGRCGFSSLHNLHPESSRKKHGMPAVHACAVDAGPVRHGPGRRERMMSLRHAIACLFSAVTIGLMNTSEVKRVIEGALLCANKPLSVSDLR